jgi:hypothetical protein
MNRLLSGWLVMPDEWPVCKSAPLRRYQKAA